MDQVAENPPSDNPTSRTLNFLNKLRIRRRNERGAIGNIGNIQPTSSVVYDINATLSRFIGAKRQ